ncbi:hypothetical protein CVT26_000635, partial [Gymnopilus dilepis]
PSQPASIPPSTSTPPTSPSPTKPPQDLSPKPPKTTPRPRPTVVIDMAFVGYTTSGSGAHIVCPVCKLPVQGRRRGGRVGLVDHIRDEHPGTRLLRAEGWHAQRVAG